MAFDRCAPDTVALIDLGLEEAQRLGHHHLGTEHILLALTRRPELLPPAVAPLLPTPEAIRDALGDGGLTAPRQRETELLRTVGVDLDQVRTAIRRTFGDEAVEGLGRKRLHRPWQPWRRPSRPCRSLLAGSLTVAPRLKEALQRAVSCSQRSAELVDPAGLLLAVLGVEGAHAAAVLRRAGGDVDAVVAALGWRP